MSQWITEEWLRQRVEGKNPIQEDRPCLHCGYNVRGLKMGQKCPECGEVISRPKVLVHMMDAPVSYLKSMRMGMWITALGTLLPIVEVVFGVPGAIRWMVEATGYAMVAWGVWILTQPRPERRGLPRRWNELPMIARAVTVTVPLLVLFETTAEMLGATFPLPVYKFLNVMFLAELVVVGLVLRDLAEWCQDHGLANGFKIVLWLLIVGYILSSLGVMIPFASRFGISVVSSVALILVGFIWYVVNVLRMAVLLNAAVRDKPKHDRSMDVYKKAL